MDGGPLNGQDALLSTVQMPGGVPVACVAIGKAGAKNAAYLAAQIMATADTGLAARLTQQREADAQAVRDKNQALQASLESTSN
jgi:5-(carboxyamino)imidazole ribonucleotide mutase